MLEMTLSPQANKDELRCWRRDGAHVRVLDAVFLSRTLAVGDQLVLPLHGAPRSPNRCHAPDRHPMAERQLAIFMNGLAGSGPIDIPGPAVKREDIEEAFTLRASRDPAEPPQAR
jgi:hypothetical protein